MTFGKFSVQASTLYLSNKKALLLEQYTAIPLCTAQTNRAVHWSAPLKYLIKNRTEPSLIPHWYSRVCVLWSSARKQMLISFTSADYCDTQNNLTLMFCFCVHLVPAWPQACTSTASSPAGTAGNLLHRTTAKTMKVLTTTGLTTKAVLTAVSDHRWWKESLNYLRPLHVRIHCTLLSCFWFSLSVVNIQADFR